MFANNFHCVVYLSILHLDIHYEQFRYEILLYVHMETYTHMDKNKALLNISNINLLILDVSTRTSSSVIQEWEYQVGNYKFILLTLNKALFS